MTSRREQTVPSVPDLADPVSTRAIRAQVQKRTLTVVVVSQILGGARHIEIVDADMVDRATVVDVRQAAEFAAGHVPGALHIELGRLTGAAATVPADRPVVTMCAHGQRSMTGASLLARHRGSTERIGVFTGSTDDWAARTGHRPAAGL